VKLSDKRLELVFYIAFFSEKLSQKIVTKIVLLPCYCLIFFLELLSYPFSAAISKFL